MKENPISFQLKLKPEDFLPATEEEKQSQVIMRESVSFWKDGARRLRKNKVAMVSRRELMPVKRCSPMSLVPTRWDVIMPSV